MKTIWGLIIFAFLVHLKGQAQLSRSSGARSAGVGDCVAVMEGPGSFPDNPAALAATVHPVVWFSAFKFYSLHDYNDVNAGFSLNKGVARIGVLLGYQGIQSLHCFNVALQYSIQLHPALKMGVRLNYENFSQGASYSHQHHGSVDFGLYWQIAKSLSWGVVVFNPVHWALKSHSPVATAYTVASGVKIQTGVYSCLYVEVGKLSGRPLGATVGMEWNFSEKITLRTGFQTATRRFSFGCGWNSKRVHIDLALSNHLFTGSAVAASGYYLMSRSTW
ncbi:MAG: hypothetical protein M0O94_03130 [Bacteroidales bacterium]|nr:hypothetical protein [Bacteroidales bacterium]